MAAIDDITNLYVGYFNRAPDAAGLNFWVAQRNGGASLESIANSFSLVPEATNLYSFLSAPLVGSSANFLSSIYLNLFGRVANATTDVEGFAYWTAQLTAPGAVVGRVIVDIISGATGNDALVVANKSAVGKAFVTQLVDTNTTFNLATAQAAFAGVTSAAATVTAAIAANNAAIAAGGTVTGQTFTFTTGVDNLTGTAGNDTFNAPNLVATAAAATFNTTDTVVGGAGTDTLSISGQQAGATVTLSNVSGVENITVFDTTGVTTSLLGSTGVTNVSSVNSTGDTTFTNIGDTSVGLGVKNQTNAGATFTFAAAAVAGTNDSATLTLSNQTGGNNVIEGIETLNIVSSGGANATGTLTAGSATTINISGNQTLNLGTANTVATTITSTSTAGVTLISNAATAATVTGGAGNDNITMTEGAAANNSVSGGAGNDTITFTANLDTTDTVAGGDDTDTLVAVSADLAAATYTLVSGFEAITVSNSLAATLTTENIQAGIATVNLAATLAASRQITMGAGSKTISQLVAATNGVTLTVVDTGTATTDALTLTNRSATADVFDAQILAITGYETVTINGSTTTAAGATQDFGTITVTPDTGGAVAINFTGNNSVTTGVITATLATSGVVDASGLTGTRTFANTGATVGITSITGTANADTLVGSATATTLIGGGGIDTITGGAAADSIDGGAGNDVIAGAGGNDVIVAGDGDDQVTDATAGSVNVNMGGGNDTYITTDALLTSGDTIVAGDGTADIFQTSTAISSGTETVSGFEILDFRENTGTQSMANFVTNAFTTVRAGAATTTFSNAGSTVTTLELGANRTAVTFSRLVDTSSNALTVTSTAAQTLDAGTVNNEETIILAGATFASVITTLNAADVTSLTLTGSAQNQITNAIAGATLLATVNASGVSGAGAVIVNATNSTVAMTVTGGTTTGNQTYTTGSGNDLVTAGAATSVNTISTGSGNDTIIGNAGADVLSGGSGIDTITGGEGADSITGGANNDTIILTETVNSVDTVVIGGFGIDTVTGFITVANDDIIQLDLSDLATNLGFVQGIVDLAAGGASADGDNIVVQSIANQAGGAEVAAAANADLFLLVGETFGSTGEVETALETGDYELTVSDTLTVGDAFTVVYSDGVDAYIASVLIAVDLGADTSFTAGDLVVTNLVRLVGNTSITTAEFVAGNFDYIA